MQKKKALPQSRVAPYGFFVVRGNGEPVAESKKGRKSIAIVGATVGIIMQLSYWMPNTFFPRPSFINCKPCRVSLRVHYSLNTPSCAMQKFILYRNLPLRNLYLDTSYDYKTGYFINNIQHRYNFVQFR